MKEYAEDELDDSKPRRHLTTEEKLCKTLLELLETEQEYIKVCSVGLIPDHNQLIVLGFKQVSFSISHPSKSRKFYHSN